MGQACASGALVILAAKAEAAPKDCRLIDQAMLRETGPIAFWVEGDSIRMETVAKARRIWSRPARPVDLPKLGADQ